MPSSTPTLFTNGVPSTDLPSLQLKAPSPIKPPSFTFIPSKAPTGIFTKSVQPSVNIVPSVTPTVDVEYESILSAAPTYSPIYVSTAADPSPLIDPLSSQPQLPKGSVVGVAPNCTAILAGIRPEISLTMESNTATFNYFADLYVTDTTDTDTDTSILKSVISNLRIAMLKVTASEFIGCAVNETSNTAEQNNIERRLGHRKLSDEHDGGDMWQIHYVALTRLNILGDTVPCQSDLRIHGATCHSTEGFINILYSYSLGDKKRDGFLTESIGGSLELNKFWKIITKDSLQVDGLVGIVITDNESLASTPTVNSSSQRHIVMIVCITGSVIAMLCAILVSRGKKELFSETKETQAVQLHPIYFSDDSVSNNPYSVSHNPYSVSHNPSANTCGSGIGYVSNRSGRRKNSSSLWSNVSSSSSHPSSSVRQGELPRGVEQVKGDHNRDETSVNYLPSTVLQGLVLGHRNNDI